jgi:Predicted O-methyltransferase
MELTNSLVTEYLNSKYKAYDDRMAEFREVGEKDMIPIILKETESVLSVLLRLKQPKRILEIGTAIGYSASFFALYCPEAEIISIEKDEYAYNAAKGNIMRLGLSDRIRLLMGDGQEQVEKIRDNGEAKFDFIFIDASKSHYRRFLDAVLTVSEKDALIVSDNILMHGMTVTDDCDPKRKHRTNIKKMREYLDFICSYNKLESSLLSIGDGLAISTYLGDNE